MNCYTIQHSNTKEKWTKCLAVFEYGGMNDNNSKNTIADDSHNLRYCEDRIIEKKNSCIKTYCANS